MRLGTRQPRIPSIIYELAQSQHNKRTINETHLLPLRRQVHLQVEFEVSKSLSYLLYLFVYFCRSLQLLQSPRNLTSTSPVPTEIHHTSPFSLGSAHQIARSKKKTSLRNVILPPSQIIRLPSVSPAGNIRSLGRTPHSPKEHRGSKALGALG